MGRGPPRGPWSKGPLMVLEARARPCSKRAPWRFWGLGRNPTRGPLSKRAPGGFGGQGGVLQEAPGQKGPLMVLEARARTP